MENLKLIFEIPDYQKEHYPRDIAFASKVNGKWESISIHELIDRAYSVSRGLLKLGLQPGDKIAVISNNRYEWHILDLAALQLGIVNVPVYPTISEADYKYIFNDAGVKLCVVSDQELYGKVNAIVGEVETLSKVYSFDRIADVAHWTEIEALGAEGGKEEVDQYRAQVKEDDLATLIYTSGTTGNPKGVMLSHRNLVSNVKACRPRLPVDHTSTAVSFLPVCHVYERMLLYLYMVTGVSVYFAESMDTIGENIKEVKPHVFTAVPRLLEKVYDKIMLKGEELTGIKRKLFFWAVSVGEEWEPGNRKGAFYNFKLGIARKLIFSKWQEALGGNARAVASGSAALQPRLARIFNAAGIPVFEGYGLTETSPVVAVNCYDNDGMRIGTVGRLIDDVEVKIAEDGEILVKGPNVMQGYYKQEEKTREAIDEDGWFHTGDIGEFQENEFLKITDRKKEIFKTSGGKYIAPQVMENKFKESKFIEQLMVIGENEKHPAALIVPPEDFMKEYCERKEISFTSMQELIQDERIIKRIQREVDELNKGFGSWEQVKKMRLLPEPWTIEGGELTPTLKLKRKVILEKYKAHVQDIYGKA